MADNIDVIIYTLEFCPNCELLKEYLKNQEIPFSEQDMSSAESLTDLRVNGVFVQEAPVLRKDSRFLTSVEMFHTGTIREDVIKKLIEGS
ncbi:MAG TPA: glutaredoxin family protein [Methanoregulaceae archaeon]|nr:glutaredoxin family protein [Methanoregulaceae archaeon]